MRGGSDSEPPLRKPPPPINNSGVDQRLGDYAVFEKQPVALPEGVAQVVHSPISHRPFVQGWPVLAALQRQVWAALDKQHLCLIDHSGLDGLGVTCSSIKRVVSQGITNTFLEDGAPGVPPRREIVGLVPDRAKKVRVHTPGFPTVTLPVENNVFVLTDQIPEPPEWLELISGQR